MRHLCHRPGSRRDPLSLERRAWTLPLLTHPMHTAAAVAAVAAVAFVLGDRLALRVFQAAAAGVGVAALITGFHTFVAVSSADQESTVILTVMSAVVAAMVGHVGDFGPGQAPARVLVPADEVGVGVAASTLAPGVSRSMTRRRA